MTVLEVQPGLLRRLEAYFGRPEWAHATDAVRETLRREIPLLLRRRPLDAVAVEHVAAAMRILPEAAALSLWDELTARVTRDEEWTWAANACARLLANDSDTNTTQHYRRSKPPSGPSTSVPCDARSRVRRRAGMGVCRGGGGAVPRQGGRVCPCRPGRVRHRRRQRPARPPRRTVGGWCRLHRAHGPGRWRHPAMTSEWLPRSRRSRRSSTQARTSRRGRSPRSMRYGSSRLPARSGETRD